MTLQRLAHRLALACGLSLPLWLAGCSTTGGAVPGQLSDAVATPRSAAHAPTPSPAANERAYRHDAAAHVYALNGQRIYAGQLPPLLYAIGTLQVRLDAKGQVESLHWMRAPTHAPEVIAEIERTVLSDAPYPVATQLGKVTWTDTWLWDKSGRFQLDTLSEGQRQQ